MKFFKLKCFIIISCILIIVIATCASAQVHKPVIDAAATEQWEYVRPAKISADGNYVAYLNEGLAHGRKRVILQGADLRWKKVFEDCTIDPRFSVFTSNSKFGLVWKGTDSLLLVSLGTGVVKLIKSVKLNDQIPVENQDWLVFRENGKLTFQNIISNKRVALENVADLNFNEAGNRALITTKIDVAGRAQQRLALFNFSDGRLSELWKGAGLANMVFGKGSEVLFLVSDESKKSSIWLSLGGKPAKQLLADHSGPISNGELSPKELRFIKYSKQVLFTLNGTSAATTLVVKPTKDSPSLTVWNYRDKTYMAEQINGRKKDADNTSFAVYDLDADKVINIEKGFELQGTSGRNICVVEKWDAELYVRRVSLVNLDNGSVKSLVPLDKGKSWSMPSISPDGRFVLFFDVDQKKWWCIDVALGEERWLSANEYIAFGEVSPEDTWVTGEGPLPVYSKDGKYAYLNDIHGDIWKVALLNDNSKAVNSTNGYGFKNHVYFRPLFWRDNIADKEILLKGNNSDTKVFGYYRLNLTKPSTPELLSETGKFVDEEVEKASSSKGYVVRRMSASVSPNNYYSRDLKSFVKLSDVRPEEKYNWLTAKLLSYPGFDNRMMNAILYLPEDFDASKKYPVILHYYTRMSDGLNAYNRPEISNGALNIPWFVSRGYLVCALDIHYALGQTGESALKSVEAAADELCKLPYVDSSKLGLQGHSFGGYETNFVVTHSNRFAAAQTGAGPSELISLYLDLQNKSAPNNILFETGQMRMGRPLWDIPEAYLKNSPVMSADKVTTPLLLLHNSGDFRVPIAQGRAMFNALRRLGKPVWLLDYDNEDHIISKDANAKDFTVRLEQFFDHYLKGKPAPLWMTSGVPYSDRGDVQKYLKLDYGQQKP